MAKKGKGLFNKQWKKTAGPTLMNAAIRGGAGVGGMFLLTDIVGRSQNPEKFGKMAGPAAVLLGAAVDVFAGNDMVRSVGQGLFVAGAIHTTGHALLGNESAKFGLAPLGGGTAGIGDVDESWEALAKESVRMAANGGGDMSGLGNWQSAAANLVSGVGDIPVANRTDEAFDNYTIQQRGLEAMAL